MAERSRDRSSSTESQPKLPECSHFRSRNDNHRRCQQCRLNDGLPLCTQDSPCLVCQDWLPEAWTAQAKATAQRNRRKAAAAAKAARKVRWWTTRWNYTHQGTLFLPSVPSPRSHLRPSGLRQSQVHRNPSPWLPASRRWNGPAPTGRTTAGRGRLSANEDTANLRVISRHVVTATVATGERASGPGQVPLVGPARVDVPSPAVSRRRRTPVRQALPLAIISIILRAIVDPCLHLHHRRLQTASLSPVTARDDERAPTGRVGRLLSDGSSSYPLRNPRPWGTHHHSGCLAGSTYSYWIVPSSSSPGPSSGRLSRCGPGSGRLSRCGPGSERRLDHEWWAGNAQRHGHRQRPDHRSRIGHRQRPGHRGRTSHRGRLGNRGRLGHRWRPCHSGRPDHSCGYRQHSRCLDGGVITQFTVTFWWPRRFRWSSTSSSSGSGRIGRAGESGSHASGWSRRFHPDGDQYSTSLPFHSEDHQSGNTGGFYVDVDVASTPHGIA